MNNITKYHEDLKTILKTKGYKGLKDYFYKLYNDKINKIVFFAFGDDQFEEGLKSFNLSPDNIKETLLSIGMGGYLLKSKEDEYKKANEELDNNYITMRNILLNDYEELKKAIIYEMSNFEYIINGDDLQVLDALNMDLADLNNKPELNTYKEARKEYFASVDY